MRIIWAAKSQGLGKLIARLDMGSPDDMGDFINFTFVRGNRVLRSVEFLLGTTESEISKREIRRRVDRNGFAELTEKDENLKKAFLRTAKYTLNAIKTHANSPSFDVFEDADRQPIPVTATQSAVPVSVDDSAKTAAPELQSPPLNVGKTGATESSPQAAAASTTVEKVEKFNNENSLDKK